MPLKNQNPEAPARYVEKRLQAVRRVLARDLMATGETGKNTAREAHNYLDQTGNLTSSIGYTTVMDGKVVHTGRFEKVKNGDEGIVRGPEYAEQLAKQCPEGAAVILVAGMPYAGHVSNLGYSVLDAGRLAMPQYLARQLAADLGITLTTR